VTVGVSCIASGPCLRCMVFNLSVNFSSVFFSLSSIVSFVSFFLPNSLSPHLEVFLRFRRRSLNLVLAFLIMSMEISLCS
jgi:hypothetical protein